MPIINAFPESGSGGDSAYYMISDCGATYTYGGSSTSSYRGYSTILLLDKTDTTITVNLTSGILSTGSYTYGGSAYVYIKMLKNAVATINNADYTLSKDDVIKVSSSTSRARSSSSSYTTTNTKYIKVTYASTGTTVTVSSTSSTAIISFA